MDFNQTDNYSQYDEQQIEKDYVYQVWKERIYRFFYNIWPGVQRLLMFLFYHTMRIIRGFFKVAFDSFKGGA